MGSVNKVILIGHLGADPELRYTASGVPVANIRIATTDRYKDKEGQLQEKTEWHRVVVWGKQAEHVGQYLKKGRQVYVEGSLETREWTDRDGNKRYTTEVRARQVVFLGGWGQDGGGQRGSYGGRSSGYQGGGYGPPQGGGYGPPQGGGYAPPQGGGYGPPQGGGYGPPQGGGYAPPPQGGSPEPAPAKGPDQDGYFQEGPDGLSDDDIPF